MTQIDTKEMSVFDRLINIYRELETLLSEPAMKEYSANAVDVEFRKLMREVHNNVTFDEDKEHGYYNSKHFPFLY